MVIEKDPDLDHPFLGKPKWGPNNPHPLSLIRTQLFWEGKYDEYGNRRELDLVGCTMPKQKIETVDEPGCRLRQLGLFDEDIAYKDNFRNQLVWGDNKLVMASLLSEFQGQIDLIYIDPPFDVGADFTMELAIGEDTDTIEKDQSTLEMVAYRDTWGRGMDSYLAMMFERLQLMKALLSPTGSIFVHCDWHVAHLLRLLMEELWAKDLFVNEIVWKRKGGSANPTNRLGTVTDSILWFAASASMTFYPQFSKDSPETLEYIKERFTSVDEKTKRLYRKSPIVSPNPRPNLTYEYKGFKPPKNGWSISRELMEEWDRDGKLYFPPEGSDGRICRKVFLDEYKGQPIQNLWTDIFVINPVAKERLNYPTQKPESLLKRIIELCTKEGDIVADFFCGSGTTLSVAEKMNRRWIGADLGRFAIHTSRKRMIEVQRDLYDCKNGYRSFDVYNLGRYERQWWQREHLKGADEEHRRVVLSFYKAEVLTQPPSPLLHGRKGSAFVNVDNIDSLLTRAELDDIAKACHLAGGSEVHCLAWEFEMELKLHAQALEKQFDVRIKLIPIPREIMEKNRKEPPPFLEVAELEAKPVVQTERGKKYVDVKLTRFLPSLAEIPSSELEALKQRAIKSGFDFIDFWAVDFDYDDHAPFNHCWQTYRTQGDRQLSLVSSRRFEYEKSGKHTICVKVIDIFGSDTTISVEVDV